MESRERARSAVRKEKLNRKRWQSEPRVNKEAQSVLAAPESKQQKLEKDVQKNEIRLTLPQTMALEKLANMKSSSVPLPSKVNVGIWLMTVILTIHQNISSQAFCSEALKKPDGNLISSKSLRKSPRSLILKSNSSRVQRGTRYLQRLNSKPALNATDTVIKFSNHFHRKPGGKYFHKKLSSFGKRN